MIEFVRFLVHAACTRGHVSAKLVPEGIAFEVGAEAFLVSPEGARGRLRLICPRLAMAFDSPLLYGAEGLVREFSVAGEAKSLRLGFANSNVVGVWFELDLIRAPRVGVAF